MNLPQTNILEAFQKLHQAVIDASSLIYLRKIGGLDLLADTIELVSIPEIIAEIQISMSAYFDGNSPAAYYGTAR